ncbi:MAG: glucose 1-dehydrogenase [Candidatus Omnitrophica bacterium]|nr:glucose 1-dehydrogenase [Candidatus Omnitrophota bacterium]
MGRKHRVAVVTGGGQGIGKCVALRFLEEGFRVVIAELDREAGEETEQEGKDQGIIKFIECDTAVPDSVEAMVEQAVQVFGRIDVLVNNAAVVKNASLEEFSHAEWNRQLAVNLTGYFLSVKHCAPYLRKSRGAVVNIASTRALMSEADTFAYSASKGGVLALTHSLAVSLGPEIRVNAVSPGWIDVSGWAKSSRRKKETLTKVDHAQHPAGRVGIPDDVARAVKFLGEPENSFVTGVNLIVDGGMTRKMIYAE